MRVPRTVLGPVVSLFLLALFLVLSCMGAILSTFVGVTAADGDEQGRSGTASRYVVQFTIYDVGPGDHVEFGTPVVNGFDAAGPHVKVLIVEGGEGKAYETGGTAAHVLRETSYPEASGTFARYSDGEYGPLHERFERPDIYAGKPHASGLNGDLHDAIDFVFLYDRPAGMDQATWDSTRGALGQMTNQFDYTVAREPWVSTQWLWLVGAILSAVAAVATTVTWVRARTGPMQPAAGLEGLVGIRERAFGYLLTLRNTMRGAGALLAVGGLGCFGALNFLINAAEYEPWGWWNFTLMVTGGLTVVAALIVWTIQYRRIDGEVKRWQAAGSPMDA